MPTNLGKFFVEQKHWAIGIAVVIVGVLVAKIVSGYAGDAQFLVLIIGHVICLLGFFAIIHGICRRKTNSSDSDDEDKE
ncbi:MAG: hypothetical protein LUD52_05900 [Opitutae bacterium]|nr:hypothetical protein [Opitutae bacterium]